MTLTREQKVAELCHAAIDSLVDEPTTFGHEYTLHTARQVLASITRENASEKDFRDALRFLAWPLKYQGLRILSDVLHGPLGHAGTCPHCKSESGCVSPSGKPTRTHVARLRMIEELIDLEGM